MTGEITLRGRVLPVGGVRDKVLAAHRAGLKTIVIPQRNKKDLIDIPKRARNDLHIVTVERMEGVLDVALMEKKISTKPRRTQTRRTKSSPKSTSRESRNDQPGEAPPLQPGV